MINKKQYYSKQAKIAAWKVRENEKQKFTDEEEKIVYDVCLNVSGPILCAYVLWVLKQAFDMGIKHLYFLARDGKIMYELASVFIDKFRLPIQCRYLYCSRLALRKPLYYIDRQEALEKLCVNGFEVTPETVMERSGLGETETKEVFDEIGISKPGRSAILSGRGLEILKESLSRSKAFDKYMSLLSKKHFENALEYFRQEGLLGEESYALVDSGWTGSMQRSIRMILEKAGFERARLIRGFYFGIFLKTKPEDGIYHCFYFYDRWKVSNSILFNHNLFECWCMADHGMTLEYRQDSQERIEPYISDYKPLWKENLQLQLHIRFARQLADGLEWECLYAERLPDAVKSTIRKISVCPDRRMAEVYGAIPFCDDPTESYMIPLARHISFEDLLGNLLLVRLYTKFFAKNKHRHFTESYWPEGTIAYLAWYQRWFLRTDKCVEYSLKLIRKKVGL